MLPSNVNGSYEFIDLLYELLMSQSDLWKLLLIGPESVDWKLSLVISSDELADILNLLYQGLDTRVSDGPIEFDKNLQEPIEKYPQVYNSVNDSLLGFAQNENLNPERQNKERLINLSLARYQLNFANLRTYSPHPIESRVPKDSPSQPNYVGDSVDFSTADLIHWLVWGGLIGGLVGTIIGILSGHISDGIIGGGIIGCILYPIIRIALKL